MPVKETVDQNGGPNTLYVVNLHSSITEDLIVAVFGQVGCVKSCRMIREPGRDPHCLVEFEKQSEAKGALSVMNNRELQGREIKVCWASDRPKLDKSPHHCIFVGGLSPEIGTDQLKNAFSTFGEISDCYVPRDPVTNLRKSYGFCSFLRKEEAAVALVKMDGQLLGTNRIRTRWANRQPLNYDFKRVFNSSSPSNCTVYVWGFSAVEGALRRAFNQFGRIQEWSYFKDKRYAFVKYDNRESACNAIVSFNFSQVFKCSWAKEGGESSKSQSDLHKEETGGYTAESGDYEAEQQHFGLLQPEAQLAASPAAKQLQQLEGEDKNGEPKSLYVVNLNSSITEDLIVAMFWQVGGVKSCRVIREPGYDPHCLVELEKHCEAKGALSIMNKRKINGREIKVYWASDRPKLDKSPHRRIFVGGLSPEIGTDKLKNAFSVFGEISDCHLIKSVKSCGFCTFVRKEDAAEALKQMDGQLLGKWRIRTRWSPEKNSDFKRVFDSASPNNCTLHVIGFSKDGEAFRRAFNPFGRILKVKHFKEKGYSFVRYDSKEAACNAIVSLNFTVVGGQVVRCSWAKEGGDSSRGQGYQHKEHPAGHKVESGGDPAEQEGYIAPGSFCSLPLKELPGPFHSPRPQQHSGFWM